MNKYEVNFEMKKKTQKLLTESKDKKAITDDDYDLLLKFMNGEPL